MSDGATLSLARLHSTIRDLPYGLREQIIGFATYIDDASDDLLDAVGFSQPTRNQVDELLYIASKFETEGHFHPTVVADNRDPGRGG
jgi:hypothetical protein